MTEHESPTKFFFFVRSLLVLRSWFDCTNTQKADLFSFQNATCSKMSGLKSWCRENRHQGITCSKTKEHSYSDDKEHFSELFDKDFFDLIIVDECHRGSAKEDSKWRRILEYFSSATQIGMTATPKETTYTSNIDYFGKPIYTYSLKNGIED
ncbi:MAG: DEAD/DEAH box helicase family protein, partial [Ruminococcus sp.]|nr:DEAD/DEAH box helicase family protein [Ruminococcus sp.]